MMFGSGLAEMDGPSTDAEVEFRDDAPRGLVSAMVKGWRGTCPACGRGKLFARHLATEDRCSECGEELCHHQADDFPAYLNIFVVGHVVVGAMMVAMAWLTLPIWALTGLTAAIAVAASVLLMRPIKGMVVGAQWALRMHGFGDD